MAAYTVTKDDTRYFVVKAASVTIDTGEYINIDVALAGQLQVNGTTIAPVEGSDIETGENISYDLTK